MQNMYNQSHVQRLQAAAAARLNHFHGPKRQLLGNKPTPAPAWRQNLVNGVTNSGVNGAAKGKEVGSKILLSRLPVDVTAAEVEELFKKTIGPLKDMFLVYNNQGKSKGMAVVVFTRPGDAAIARQKYDGKIVDGPVMIPSDSSPGRPIKVEVVYDGVPGALEQTAPLGTPALLNRLGGKLSDASSPKPAPKPAPAPNTQTLQQRTQPPVAPALHVVAPRRVRFKKGPKRLKKQHLALGGTVPGGGFKKGPPTKDDLDKEMEDYRAAAPSLGLST